MKITGRKFGAVLLAIGVVLVLTACGQTKKSQDKQTLNLSATAPLPTIDISKSTGYGQTGNVFESFFRLGANGQTEPGLAKSATVSKNGLTWTFKLRDAKWSNGDRIIAQDFVYSWRRTINPATKSQYAYLFNGIKNASKINAGKASPNTLGIKALNSRTVVVSLDKPMTYFKVLMAYPLFAPQNQRVIKKYGKKYATKSEYMVYSGPFKIQHWNGTGNKWQFVKNPNYWDAKVVKLKKVNFTVVADPGTGLDLYQRDKLDLTPLANQQVKNYKNDKAFKEYPYSYVSFLKYNLRDSNATLRKALNNRNIRLALSLALNRQALTEKVLGDGSETPTGFVASGLATDPKTGVDFSKQQAVKNTVNYNVKLAKADWQRGMRQIGAKNLHFTLLAGADQTVTSPLTQYLKGQWEKELPGLTVDIKTMATQQIAYQSAAKGDFDVLISGWGADFNDPISFLQIPMSGTSYNFGHYRNEAYDRLVNRAVNADANNPEKRWQDLVSAAKIFNADQGMTPLYQQVTAYLQRSDVHGIVHNTAGTQWSYKTAYIK
ncbi:ABC transporter, substrate-binding protein, family 5 [Secundilactobacillus kimchicus JCM 15530]|uniref:ABC transporter, substrate-binding protein, family 5 n=1 Tax=Secundilactobacillus kimchicus JCM 15530 TaxID=1302272 RepID=A0A0R1HQ79_9LACO|nr:peptide ABC transporter substrate-binding protein [Secundilactobacillus kimchicus]KRK48630.1 ABC transporter, substrate-binding protein, family 5 [Secundilactobacillus kimchicus JCM 15530]